MQILPPTEAPPGPPAVFAPTDAHIPAANAAFADHSVRVNSMQAAPPTTTASTPPVGVAATPMAPSARPVITPIVVVPNPDVTMSNPVDPASPTSTTINPEAETRLTAEIAEL